MDIQLLSCGYSYHVQPFVTAPIYHTHYLFRLQTEGRAKASVDGVITPVEAGDLLMYKPGDYYELQIKEEEPGAGVASGDYFLLCRGEWIRRWWERRPRAQRTRIDPHDELMAIWKQLVLERRRLQEMNEELSGYLLQALCVNLDRALTTSPAAGGSFTVSRMKRYIEVRATHAFQVEDVAKHVGLSPSRAAHLFKETYGDSIMQYALKVRLAMVIDRMKYSALTLEQIAESCGLPSYPYFHRVFKARFGCSPREYRSEQLFRS